MEQPIDATGATGAVVAAKVRRRPHRVGPLDARIERLMDEVGLAVRAGMREDAQVELARLVALLPMVADARTPRLYPPIEAAIRGLLGSEPNLLFARRIRRATWQKFRRRYRLLPLMLGLAVGLVVFTAGYFLIFALLGPRQRFLGFDEPTVTNIAFITLTGALGASVSLVLRIRDFSKLREVDPEALLYTAIFKPILGAAFSLFVFLALNAGIVTISVPAGKEKFLYGAIAFVAGFSERFTKDVISKVAGSIDDDGDTDEDGELELAALAEVAPAGSRSPAQDGHATPPAPAALPAPTPDEDHRPARPPRRRVGLRVSLPRRPTRAPKPPAGS
jgi:hypothetical protein